MKSPPWRGSQGSGAFPGKAEANWGRRREKIIIFVALMRVEFHVSGLGEVKKKELNEANVSSVSSVVYGLWLWRYGLRVTTTTRLRVTVQNETVHN